MKPNNKFTISALALLSVFANASAADTNLSYNFVDAGYENMAPPDDSDDFNGLTITASKIVWNNLFVTAGYSNLSHREELDEYDLDQFRLKLGFETFKLGVGYAEALNDSVDIFTVLSIFDKELQANGIAMSLDTTTYGVGLRSGISDNLEVNTSLSYHEVKNDELSGSVLKVGGVYKLNDKLSATASFAKDNGFETDHIEVGVRYYF